MNTMLLLWLLTFAASGVLAFKRSAWAVVIYMLTFFMAPPFWWWGDSISMYRWNLYAGFILIGSSVLSGALRDPGLLRSSTTRWFLMLALFAVLNALVVHTCLAPNALVSSDRMSTLVKTMVLFVLMIACIRDLKDINIVLTAVLVGASYIGYEVTVNDRGHVYNNRLEGVGVPNASTANGLACLMVCTMPLIAPLFLHGKLWQKAIAVSAGPLILNVLFLCNSRGAFLSLGIFALLFLIGAPKSVRPQVIKISCLGLLAGWLLLGDPRIVERFMTTFQSTDDLDQSATNRFDFWNAGLAMIVDHPLGAGGDGFVKAYGAKYIGDITGIYRARSVHQGYLNEACDWGLQGLLLRLMILVGGLRLALRTSKLAAFHHQHFLSILSLSLASALAALMFQSLFGTFLDNEWGLWLVAFAVGCRRLVDEEAAELQAELLEEEDEDWDYELDDHEYHVALAR